MNTEMDHSTCNIWFYNYVIKNVKPNIVCMYSEIHFVMKNAFTSYILEVLQKRQHSMQSDMENFNSWTYFADFLYAKFSYFYLSK